MNKTTIHTHKINISATHVSFSVAVTNATFSLRSLKQLTELVTGLHLYELYL